MPARHCLAGLAVAASAIVAAGCGTSAPVSPSGSQAASSSATQHAATCQPSQLRLTVGQKVSEATQQSTLLLVFRNIAATKCYLRGYPRIALADNSGAPLPFSYAQRGDQMLTSRRPGRVALPSGGVAYSAINKTTCTAFASRTAARAWVTPPGDHEPLSLRLPRYPVLGYCGAGDPGHVVDIAPVEQMSVAVLAG